jgi:hypothetical protein
LEKIFLLKIQESALQLWMALFFGVGGQDPSGMKNPPRNEDQNPYNQEVEAVSLKPSVSSHFHPPL